MSEENFQSMAVPGWIGQDLAQKAYDEIGGDVEPKIVGDPPVDKKGHYSLFELTRKVLGKDAKDKSQGKVGSCLGHAVAHTLQDLEIAQIANGDPGQFKYIFIPYTYGISRVVIGKGQINLSEDGSCGIWGAKALKDYGCFNEDYEGLPVWSPDVDRAWGKDSRVLTKWQPVGANWKIGAYTKITTVDQAITFLAHGYSIQVCSSVGFTMMAQNSGYHEVNPRDPWSHAMSINYYSGTPGKECFGLHNSWLDQHGVIIDWDNGQKWPIAHLRIRPEAVAKILAAGDSYAYSKLPSFDPRPTLWDDFTTFQ